MSEGPGWVAQSFSKADDIGGVTQTIGSGELCDAAFCDGFDYIQCADSRQTHAAPQWNGLRVDWCATWGTDCGQGGADLYCEMEHGVGWYSDSYVAESNVGPTLVLGDGNVCNSSSCDGFAEVTCAYVPPMTEVTDDYDLDGVTDSADNCPGRPNPLQENADGDEMGDACDAYPSTVSECSDGIDNDGDGATDAGDAGCWSTRDHFETSLELVCDDGQDNDGDGAADYPADPNCFSSTDPTEATECGDGIDNDGDGVVDELDADCSGSLDDSEWHLEDGDVLVADWNAKLIRVNPATGARQVLHTGAPFNDPMGVAIAPGGDILISDNGADSVFRVHQQDGSVSTVTYKGHLSSPRYMTMDPDGNALVCNQNGWVVRVDLDTGEQLILNSSTGIGWCEGVTANAEGEIVVADRSGDRIVEVDAATGAMNPMQPGGPFGLPIGIAFEDADHVLVGDDGANELYRVTLSTGSRSTLSLGQAFSRLRGVAVGGEGQIYAVDLDGGLIRIDPSQSAATNQEQITGGDMGTPMGVVTYVPESGATPLLAAGVLLLSLLARRELNRP
jgi:hypothetical protein